MVRRDKKLIRESSGSVYDMIAAIEDRIEDLENGFYDEGVDLDETYSKGGRQSFTQRELKNLVRNGRAEDITNYSFEEANDLYDRGYDVIGVSHGTYGMNGALLQMRDTRELLVITARGSVLFQLVS